MAGPAAVLREIHRLRRLAKELEIEIERNPRLVNAQHAKVTRQEELLRETQDGLKLLKVASHDKESQLKSILQQISKHEKQLNEAASKKEYDALKSEIEADRKKCQKLEDEILDCLIQIDERTAQLPQLDKTLQQAKVDAQEFEKTSESRVAGLKEQLSETRQAIKDVEETLPEDARAHLNRLISIHGEEALAAVNNRTCMACYTEITAQAFTNLSQGQFLLCKNCGRALYLPE